MTIANVSIQSKAFKSRAEKSRKREKLDANHRHRAALHSAKAACSSSTAAAIVQSKIDQLSKGVHA
mgnify:CR=1 FL=1